MTFSFDNRPELVEPAARTILGAIDLGDGGIEKQRHLLQAIASKVWERPDIDIDSLTPLSPEEAAEIFDTPLVRSRLRKFLVLFEFCRHPFTEEQVALVDSYELALGDDGHDEGLQLARDFVREGLPKAIEDVQRLSAGSVGSLSEVSIADHFSEMDMKAPELADELRRFADLPPGTLGREYVDFYFRNSFELPGEGHGSPSFFVRHDMCHIIAGYGPTSPEELALSAFHVGMNDNEINWNFLIISLAALELGLFNSDSFEGKSDILDRDGALELMVEGFVRGSHCTGDFSEMDHLADAHCAVEEIRERFGVPARQL
ncbi:MAG: hypothetical protein WCJ88_06720 [Actinomycetes bacterium]